MLETLLDLEIPSTLTAVEESLDEVLSSLTAQERVSADRIKVIHLCLEEALINAIRHGNRQDGAKTVRLTVAADTEMWVFSVFDQGFGFDPGKIILPKSDVLGGRGVCLMRHFADRLTYDKKKRCLEIQLRKHEP